MESSTCGPGRGQEPRRSGEDMPVRYNTKSQEREHALVIMDWARPSSYAAAVGRMSLMAPERLREPHHRWDRIRAVSRTVICECDELRCTRNATVVNNGVPGNRRMRTAGEHPSPAGGEAGE